jgi:hypothetical protein
MKPQAKEQNAPSNAPIPPLSRRAFFQCSGASVAALMLLAASHRPTAAGVIRSAKPISAVEPLGAFAFLQRSGGISDNDRLLQFPYFSDAPWDQPQYYQTIQAGRRMFPKTRQSADIDGDGRDELIARGPGGIIIHKYDQHTGQWVPMPDGPKWDDASFYDHAKYYQTIQTADINNDGQAELLIRDHEGVKTWRYDLHNVDSQGNPNPIWKQIATGGSFPQLPDSSSWDMEKYYQTLQCANVNGDRRAKLLVRSSEAVLIWEYDTPSDSWVQIFFNSGSPDDRKEGPYMPDVEGYSNPSAYQTLQCADINRDGRDEILVHSTGGTPSSLVGLSVWNLNTFADTWSRIADSSIWNDQLGWNQPQYYGTIVCGDVDGDGYPELVDRAPDNDSIGGGGLRAWKLEEAPGGYGWKQLPRISPGPVWTDALNWNRQECYSTIQCADIDGDGQDEVLGRGSNGVEVWKFDTPNGKWRQLKTMPFWSDANGWNQGQYYETIQTARVLKPGDPGYIVNGTHTQAVLLGRGPGSMQTWRYVDEEQGWVRTSAPLPVFTRAQQEAYAQIGTQIGEKDANDIRAWYNNADHVDNKFPSWQEAMYQSPLPDHYDQVPRPLTRLPKPATVSPDDWEHVVWQIWWEMTWVKSVRDWYGDGQMGGLFLKHAFLDLTTLQKIGNYVNIPPDSTQQIVFTVLGMVASVVAAILTGGASIAAEGAALGVASAIAGGIGAAFSTAGSLPGGGGSFQDAYNRLLGKIGDSFDDAYTNNGANLFALTGGMIWNNEMSQNQYVAPDYGRLKLIGEWIEHNVWVWYGGPDGGTGIEFLNSTGQKYGIYVWQTLLNAQKWYIWAPYGIFPGHGFPSAYLYENKYWLNSDYTNGFKYVSTDALSDLFDTSSRTKIFPLGVPLEDVYLGLHGWPKLPGGQAVTPPTEMIASDLPSLGVSVRLTAALSRDPITNEVVAEVTLRNEGVTPATNVEIGDATLGGQRMTANHAVRRLRLFYGHPQTIRLQFPATSGRAAVLKIAGQFLGGTFGGSFRVTVPPPFA